MQRDLHSSVCVQAQRNHEPRLHYREPTEIVDAGTGERLVPGLRANLLHGSALVCEYKHGMPIELSAHASHRRAVEWHRDRLSRLGLIRMNPRESPTEIHLVPAQACYA